MKTYTPTNHNVQQHQLHEAEPTALVDLVLRLVSRYRAGSSGGRVFRVIVRVPAAGAGTTHHLAAELFKILTKTRIGHVPYRGAGPAMQDLVAGHVPVVFDGLGSSAAQIRSGALRALAVAAPKRVSAFPDLPTAAVERPAA